MDEKVEHIDVYVAPTLVLEISFSSLYTRDYHTKYHIVTVRGGIR